jgi:hypothetical protein
MKGYWEEKSEMPLGKPQIPHGLGWGLNPEHCGERPATNRLELSNHLTF